jgi:hypothetical protein
MLISILFDNFDIFLVPFTWYLDMFAMENRCRLSQYQTAADHSYHSHRKFMFSRRILSQIHKLKIFIESSSILTLSNSCIIFSLPRYPYNLHFLQGIERTSLIILSFRTIYLRYFFWNLEKLLAIHLNLLNRTLSKTSCTRTRH